jgi:hypothetical protein
MLAVVAQEPRGIRSRWCIGCGVGTLAGRFHFTMLRWGEQVSIGRQVPFYGILAAAAADGGGVLRAFGCLVIQALDSTWPRLH